MSTSTNNSAELSRHLFPSVPSRGLSGKPCEESVVSISLDSGLGHSGTSTPRRSKLCTSKDAKGKATMNSPKARRNSRLHQREVTGPTVSTPATTMAHDSSLLFQTSEGRAAMSLDPTLLSPTGRRRSDTEPDKESPAIVSVPTIASSVVGIETTVTVRERRKRPVKQKTRKGSPPPKSHEEGDTTPLPVASLGRASSR